MPNVNAISNMVPLGVWYEAITPEVTTWQRNVFHMIQGTHGYECSIIQTFMILKCNNLS